MSDGLSNFALADFFCAVGSFLEIHDLGRLERASSFYLEVLISSWNVTASRLFSDSLCWGPAALKYEEGLYEDYQGKSLALQLHKFRRAIFPSKSWEPWVCKTSFCSARANGVLDCNCRSVQMSAPHQASVAASVGISRGQTLVVGTTLEATGSVKDEVCIGIVALEGPSSSEMTSIMFAPFSGDCFIQHGSNGAVCKTQAIPCQACWHDAHGEPLQACWHDAHGEQVVKAWVQVTAVGGIRFLSQTGDAAIIETGLMPPEFLPKSINAYFASMNFRMKDLTATVKVSVDYSGSKFPSNMHVSHKPPFEMDTAWELLDEEFW